MKMILRGAITVFVIFIISICLLDTGTSVVRRNETAKIAENATYETLNAIKNESTDIGSDQEMIAEIIKNIVIEYDSNSDVEVRIISLDSRNGLLDLEIIQTFKHSNGEEETVSERRTVILEDYREAIRESKKEEV